MTVSPEVILWLGWGRYKCLVWDLGFGGFGKTPFTGGGWIAGGGCPNIGRMNLPALLAHPL